MFRFRWLMTFVAAGIGVAAVAQEKVTFKTDFAPGIYVMTWDTTMDTTSKRFDENGETTFISESRGRTIRVTELDVAKADADGNRIVNITLRRIVEEWTTDDGKRLRYDSAGGETVKRAPEVQAYLDRVRTFGDHLNLGKTISLTMDAAGNIRHVESEALVEAMANIKAEEAVREQRVKSPDDFDLEQAKTECKQQLTDTFEKTFVWMRWWFPDKPVAKGDTWKIEQVIDTTPKTQPVEIKAAYTLVEVKNGVATVKFTSTDRNDVAPRPKEGLPPAVVKGTSTGVMEVDLATGMVLSYRPTHRVTITYEFPRETTTSVTRSEFSLQKGPYKPATSAPAKP